MSDINENPSDLKYEARQILAAQGWASNMIDDLLGLPTTPKDQFIQQASVAAMQGAMASGNRLDPTMYVKYAAALYEALIAADSGT
jgi:hypothetical protein